MDCRRSQDWIAETTRLCAVMYALDLQVKGWMKCLSDGREARQSRQGRRRSGGRGSSRCERTRSRNSVLDRVVDFCVGRQERAAEACFEREERARVARETGSCEACSRICWWKRLKKKLEKAACT